MVYSHDKIVLLTDLPSCAMLEPVFVETTNCDMHTTEAQNTEPQRTGYIDLVKKMPRKNPILLPVCTTCVGSI